MAKRPTKKSNRLVLPKKRDDQLKKVLARVDEHYGSVFRRLAK